MLGNNRVTAMVQSTKKTLAEKLAAGTITQEAIDSTNKSLDINYHELAAFQELKSIAMLHEKITQDEAQTVYMYLGEGIEKFNSQPVEVKVTITKLMAELMKWKMGLKAA